MDRDFKPDGDKQTQLRGTYESNSAQVQQLAESLHKSELEHQQLHAANERRLQFEAQALRMSQDMEQQALSIAHQCEVEVRQRQEAAQPDCSSNLSSCPENRMGR